MAIARIAVRTHSRRRGHSAAAAWAYRAGRCFTCARTGRKHDYRPRTRRSDDVVDTGLAWTCEIKGTPALARDEQRLLDAIEHAERRRDAKILRDIQLALPTGLSTEVLVELVREYAQWVADEYHTLAMWAIHRPGRLGDERNLHAHILVPTRQLDVSGEEFGPKLRVLDDWKSGPVEVCKIRNHWCESANRRLERAGVEARIHAGRRLDAPPMPTIPERFVARDYAMKRAAGLASEPLRVAELAALGAPQNAAMARIVAHVEAGHDVPVSERVYEPKARPYHERAEEHDETQRTAAHYAGLPVVREALAEATAELDALEARIEALDAANAPGPPAPESVVVAPATQAGAPPALDDDEWAREPALTPRSGLVLDAGDEPAPPEPVVVVPSLQVAAPPVLEDDEWARESGLGPGRDLVPDADDEAVLPDPVVVVPAQPVAAPPALEDGEWTREPALTPRSGLVLDAGDEPAPPEPVVVVPSLQVAAPPVLEDDEWARESGLGPGRDLVPDADDEAVLPDPVVVVPAQPVAAPPALEDDEEALERELGRLVDQVEQWHNALERIEIKVARELSDPHWLAATVEEAMRQLVLDAPAWRPRLADIPRRAETNELGIANWRFALRPEMDVLLECGKDRERIERHIAAVRERAKTDAAWRNKVVASIGEGISPPYLHDLLDAGYFGPEPAKDEAEDALLGRLMREGASGGLDAWSEQTIARAAGLAVDFSFGQWSRERDSGLLAEDVLTLHLHDAVRAARRLNRTFPGNGAAQPAGATTLREWYRGLARLISGVRERLQAPGTHERLITDIVVRMVPDLRAEWARGDKAIALGPTPETPPAAAERDRTLCELARARARNAGIDDALENPDRVRLGRELDERLEDMLQHVCLFDPSEPSTVAMLAPDGVPESGKTARALADGLARWFRPVLERIRAHTGTEGRYEFMRREVERCREHVSVPKNRRLIVDDLVAAAGAHYEAEWLPAHDSKDRRGAREREEHRAALETQIHASAEAAGEARILGHVWIPVVDPLPRVSALNEYLGAGGFFAGIVVGRPERAPVQNAVKRWREHCATHRGEVASMLHEAMWPEHWEHYRRYRRRTEVERVPTREERDQAILDATESPAPTPPRSPPSRNQGRGPGC